MNDLYEKAKEALDKSVEKVYDEAKRKGRKLPIWKNGKIVYLDYKNFAVNNITNYLADHYHEIYLNRKDEKEQRKIAKRILHYAFKGYR